VQLGGHRPFPIFWLVMPILQKWSIAAYHPTLRLFQSLPAISAAMPAADTPVVIVVIVTRARAGELAFVVARARIGRAARPVLPHIRIVQSARGSSSR
jgi:hypothetical protein